MKEYKLNNFLIDKYIMAALEEDINWEDITTNSVISEKDTGRVDLICKEDGILAGIDVFQRVFTLLDDTSTFEINFKDGEPIKEGDLIGRVYSSLRTLLSGERVALNFLQRMCGIATYTNKFAKELEGSKTQIVDTRKTTPNFRIFEKQAVRIGGGGNHRYNLSDGILLKDNHINAAGSVTKAVEMARDYGSFVKKIEIEVEDMDMVKEAVAAKADIIMLDNMKPDEIREAVEFIDGRALIELSGNITLENVRDYRDLGADIISSGSITHSAPVLDLSMKNLSKDK